MSRLHDDGWGTTWIEDTPRHTAQLARLRCSRGTVPGYADPKLEFALRQVVSRAQLVHLRMATGTFAVQESNSHPFTDGSVALAHNGSIVPSDALREMVPSDLRADVQGTTDSELYFALVRDGVRHGLAPVDAVHRAVGRIREHYLVASLNAVLLTANELIVVHANAGAPVPYHDFVAFEAEQAAVTHGHRLPEGHDDGYFQMHWRRAEDGSVVVASAGLDFSGWEEMPQDSIIVVDLRTDAVSLQSVHASAALVAV